MKPEVIGNIGLNVGNQKHVQTAAIHLVSVAIYLLLIDINFGRNLPASLIHYSHIKPILHMGASIEVGCNHHAKCYTFN